MAMPDGWGQVPVPPIEQSQSAATGLPAFQSNSMYIQQPPGLPQGWEMKLTPDGQTYFENHHTKSTQWNRPEQSEPPPGHTDPNQDIRMSELPPRPDFVRDFTHPHIPSTSDASQLMHSNSSTRTGGIKIEGYSKAGNPIVQSSGEDPVDTPIFSSNKFLGEVYGKPIEQYFNFILFIIITNAIFVLISLIGYVPHHRNTNAMLKTVGAGWLQTGNSLTDLDILFLSSVQPSSDGTWIAMIAISCCFSFLTGPLYWLASKFIFKDDLQAATDDEPDFDAQGNPVAQLTGKDLEEFMRHDEIQDNKDVEAGYNCRLVFNYILFLICCFIPGGIMYAVLFTIFYATMQDSFDQGQDVSSSFAQVLPLVLAVIPSTIVVIGNAVFGNIVMYLNDWDKHPTWSQFRRHRIAKTLMFRIINVMFLFVFKYYSDKPFYTCITQRLAFQIFTFIIMELTINNFLEIFLPAILQCLPFCGAACGGVGKPEFELADEYFEIVYRQFIMYFGIQVFPMITVVTLGANILEYLVDRYRLIKVCAKPKGVMPSAAKSAVKQLICAAVCGLIAFPCGPIWFTGQYLCWPCTQYSATTIFSSTATLATINDASSLVSCSRTAAFEQPKCTLDDGTEVSTAVISMHTERLKGWEKLQGKKASEVGDWNKLYEQSIAWMKKNFNKLSSQKRCACSPCTHVITCNCGERQLENVCRNESPMHCVDTVDPKNIKVRRISGSELKIGDQDPWAPDEPCSGASTDCKMSPFTSCIENRNYKIFQCTTVLNKYTDGLKGGLDALKTTTATCGSAGGSNSAVCTKHEDCGKTGACVGGKDFYCISPDEKYPSSAKLPKNPECWVCPEQKTGGLVNPREAKQDWRRTSVSDDFKLCNACFSPFGGQTCNGMSGTNYPGFFGKDEVIPK